MNEILPLQRDSFFILVESTLTGMVMVDRSGIILYANPAAEQLFCLSRESLIGTTFGFPLLTERTEEILILRKRSFSTVEMQVAEVSWEGKTAYLVSLHDITVLKQVEQDLRQSEEHLRIVADNTYDWEYWISPEREYIWVSPSCKNVSGYSQEEFIKGIVNIRNIIHPDDMDVWGGHENELDNTSTGRRDLEFRIVKPAGEVVWINHTCKPIFDTNGQFIGHRGCNRDITGRKHSELALLESEERFKALIEKAGDAIYICDSTGRFLRVNLEAEKQTGFTREALLSMYVFDLDLNLNKESFTAFVLAMNSDGETFIETRHKRIDGRVTPVEVKIVRLDTDSGTLFLGIARDITDRKLTEEALLRAKEQAEAATRTKSEFLANMSHEIRTPMNGIFGMLQLLQTTILDEEQKEYAEVAIDSTKNLLSLISDILDYSKVEAGKLEIVEGVFVFSELCRSIPSIFKDQINKKNINFAIDIAQNVPQKVVGDAGRIRQVLFNLVGNSIKFTESGVVKVKIEAIKALSIDNLKLYFSISDTGIGIPEDRIPDLFMPFTQIDGSLTRKYQGTGLGLSIVKRLVALMGGDVSIQSKLGQGTTVNFYIQVGVPAFENFTSDYPLITEESVVNNSLAHQIKLKILLVEDDEVSQDASRLLLEKYGAKITCAWNGEEAFQAVSTEKFDLILMDVQMPIMDGVTATKKIRGLNDHSKGIPIIAMTAHVMAGDKEKFVSAGMNDYIAKPVEITALKRVISDVMRKTSANSQSN